MVTAAGGFALRYFTPLCAGADGKRRCTV